jgi:hypothetical protein
MLSGFVNDAFNINNQKNKTISTINNIHQLVVCVCCLLFRPVFGGGAK